MVNLMIQFFMQFNGMGINIYGHQYLFILFLFVLPVLKAFTIYKMAITMTIGDFLGAKTALQIASVGWMDGLQR